MTNVLVAPRRIKKPCLSVLEAFEIWFPIIAACPLPKPGNRLHKGEAINEPKNAPEKGFMISFEGFSIFCFGT
ncbi:hypothetical protein ES703_86477 [subsurface metagenome]